MAYIDHMHKYVGIPYFVKCKTTWMAKMHDNCVFISAKKQINIDELKEKLYEKAKEVHLTRFPYNDSL